MQLHNSYKYFAGTLAVTILIQCGVHLIECIKTVLLDGDHIYTKYPGISSTIQDISSLSLSELSILQWYPTCNNNATTQ